MNLYIMRHGEAVAPIMWDEADRDRPLTPLGTTRLKEASALMAQAKFNPAMVVSSPFERAMATAEIVSGALNSVELVSEHHLACGAHADDYMSVLKKYSESVSLLMVGHMPELSMFALRLTNDSAMADKNLEPGEMVAIELTNIGEWGSGKVLWSRRLMDWKKVSA